MQFLKKNKWTSFLILLILAGCQTERIEVRNAWARAAEAGQNSAIYFELQNHSDQPNALLQADGDFAAMIQIHKSSFSGSGVVSMEQVPYVSIPPNSQVSLEPGGFHIMVMNLNRDIAPGDSIDVVLAFENGEVIEMEVPARAP